LTTVGNLNVNTVERLKHYVNNEFLPILQPVHEVMSFEDWLKSTHYTKKTKQKLRFIWMECLQEHPPTLDATYSKFFGKLERYPEFKHARGINGCTEREKVFVGPAVKSIEHTFYHQFADNLVKGLPTQLKAAALSRRLYRAGSLFAGTDFSNFEGSVSRHISRAIEIPFLRTMLNGQAPSVLSYITYKLMHPHKLVSKDFVCRVAGIRCSGDMWTSLLNSVVNLVIIKFCCKELGWNAEPVVEGDDGLFRLDGPCPTSQQFSALGFAAKIDVYRTIGEAGFCKMKFDSDDVQVTEPIEKLVKFGWTSHVHATNQQVDNLLYTKALSLKAEYPHCPMLGPFADRIIALLRAKTDHLKLAFDEDPGWTARKIEMASTWIDLPSAVTLNTRLFFEHLYGISVAEQLSFERYIDDLLLHQPIQHWVVIDRCKRDWYVAYDKFTYHSPRSDW